MDAPCCSITSVDGAGITVITIDVHMDAATGRIARVRRTRVSVIAVNVLINAAAGWIAGVGGAGITVIAVNVLVRAPNSYHTGIGGAGVAVIAKPVVRCSIALVYGGTAKIILSAIDTIVTGRAGIGIQATEAGSRAVGSAHRNGALHTAWNGAITVEATVTKESIAVVEMMLELRVRRDGDDIVRICLAMGEVADGHFWVRCGIGRLFCDPSGEDSGDAAGKSFQDFAS
jgi:hypothetical protein